MIDWVKISAYDLTFDDLLEATATLGVPVVLGTAMATTREITHACHMLRYAPHVILLHGTATYPAELADARLSRFTSLSGIEAEGHCEGYGLSDHTTGITCARLAIACGATWIEKPFGIYDKNPDAMVAASPKIFQAMVAACQETQRIFVPSQGGPLPCEMPLFLTCRRTNERRTRG